MSPVRDDEDLLGLHDGRLAVGFAVGAVRRHRRLAAAVFAAVMTVTVLAFVVMPRTYHTEVRLIAQRNLVMPALGNPRRTVPVDSDAPTRLAAETVMKRENLVSVIQATHLMEEWDRTRAPILKLKDWLLRPIAGAPTEEDKLEALIWLLRKRAWVSADEGTVTIGIDWRDPATAKGIVERMQQNFLEERHASEVSSISDAISILEGHAASVRSTIESATEEVKRLPEPAGPRLSVARARPVSTPAASAPAPPPAPTDPTLASLEVVLEGKQRAIADLEEFRAKRRAQLETLLAEQKKTYGPSHPDIVQTQQSLQALTGESPQIATLKQEEAEIREQIRRHGGGESTPAPRASERAAAPAPAPAAATVSSPSVLRLEPAPEAPPSYPRSRLKSAIAEYEDLLGRLEGARIELDTARAAFKYRYGIILPAEVPKRPVSPVAVTFLGMGFVLAFGLALAAALLADLGRGRIVEPWQVKRFLGLEVLAEMPRP